MTHFVEEELRRTFAAHDPGSADSGGEILATVTRQAGRARRRRIAVAGGALAVIAVTGVALPVLWPRGGTSSLSPADGGAWKPVTGANKPPNATATAGRPVWQTLKMPADARAPLRATSTPDGYGPWAPSFGRNGLIGTDAVSRSGAEIQVTIGDTELKYSGPRDASPTQADVNGRSAYVYRNKGDAAVIWQRKADQWVIVETMSKSGTPGAEDKALQVARGLVDQPDSGQYRVLFSAGPHGYSHAQTTQYTSTIAPNGKAADTAHAISATLLRAKGGHLPAGRSFTWHDAYQAVLRDNSVADVDLGDGSWIEVQFGPAVTLAPEARPALVQEVVILPGPPPTS